MNGGNHTGAQKLKWQPCTVLFCTALFCSVVDLFGGDIDTLVGHQAKQACAVDAKGLHELLLEDELLLEGSFRRIDSFYPYPGKLTFD